MHTANMIKAEAKRLGFMFCGIAKAGFFRGGSPAPRGLA
jgi:hypothetical protein